MKLLLTTVKTNNRYTEYALKSLYSIVADAPLEAAIKIHEEASHDFDVYETVVKGQYNIVYFHCDEYNEGRIINIAEMVKKSVPSVAIVVGGMPVSVDTKEWMIENAWVDYIIRGQGERVLFTFLRSIILHKFDFADISGLAYRVGEQICVNSLNESVNMEELPFVYDKNTVDDDVVLYETIRGNTDKSIYEAFYNSNFNKPLSVTRVCKELKHLIMKSPERVIVFDKCFNYNSERAYRIFEHIVGIDNGVTTFEFNMSGEKLDDEIIRLVSGSRKGLFEFNIEIPTTNKEILLALGRNENIYQLMYNVTKLMQADSVKCNISIIAGLPDETVAQFMETFNKVYGLCAGAPLTIKTLCLAKGSTLRKYADRIGYEYSSQSPYEIISSNSIVASELIRIRNLAKVVEAYIGDGGFKTSIPMIMNDTGLRPYDLFTTLTVYIYVNGYENDIATKKAQARYLYKFANTLYETFDDGDKLAALTAAIKADLDEAGSADSQDDSADIEADIGMEGWNIEG